VARREIVTVIDDLDGNEGATTVRFAFGDQSYQIDLNEQHLKSSARHWTRTSSPAEY
jgi:hypothetical protein